MEFPPDQLPRLLTHMVVAVFKKMRGGERAKFISAMKISRARLVELRYLTPPSLEGPLDRIHLTSAGSEKNRPHMTESRAKQVEFNKLYAKYRADLEVKAMKTDPE
jgi:hypothetical protein